MEDVNRLIPNDGFCDICKTWWGHEDLEPARTSDGHHFHSCWMCKKEILGMDPEGQQKLIEKKLGKLNSIDIGPKEKPESSCEPPG